MSDTCEIKGVAFHTFFQAITELRGAAAATLVRDALAPDLGERLRRGAISRVGYYPLSEYGELHAAAQRVLPGGESLARDIGRTATEIDTRGLLRFVLGLTSASFLMRHADKAWSSYVRGSRVAVQEVEPQRYIVDFEGLAGVSELVVIELEGAIERLVQRTGARQPEVRHQARSAGKSVRYLVSWAA